MTLVVNGNIVASRVWTPEATYRISPADGGFHAIQQVDRERLPPLGDPPPRPLPRGTAETRRVVSRSRGSAGSARCEFP